MTSLRIAPLLFFALGTVIAGEPAPQESFEARLARLSARGKVLPIDRIEGKAITVDGDLNDWGNLSARSACIEQQIDQCYGAAAAGQKDAAAIKLLRDDEALYIAVRVVDASVLPVEPAWEGDCVELFLDVRPVAPAEGSRLGVSKYTDGCFQLLFTPPAKEGEKPKLLQGGQAKPAGEMQFAGRKLADGYSLEIKIPFASLGATPERFKEAIGFDVMIDDIDAIPNSTEHTAGSIYSWGGSSNYSRDPGALSLADPNLRAADAGPVLRANAARYHNANGAKVVVGGLVAALNASAADTKFSVKCTHVQKAGEEILDEEKPEPLPEDKLDVTEYPQLGFVVHRRRLDFTSLRHGHYDLETTFAGLPAASAHTGFNALSWRAKPAQPHELDKDIVLPDIVTPDGKTVLPNGWQVTPAGKHIPLPGDMPLRMIWSADGKYLLVNTGGYHHHTVNVIDPEAGRILQSIDVQKTYAGMCFDASGKTLYLSNGNGLRLLVFNFENGHLTQADPLKLDYKKKECYMAGLAASPSGSLYAVNLQMDTVLRLAGSPLTVQTGNKLGYRPFGVAVSPGDKDIAVSNWGDESVSFLDAKTLHERKRIKVGNHPNDLVYGEDGRLFVANAGTNSVGVIEDDVVTETIRTSLNPKDPVGSTPVALALSPDNHWLYVANADNNDIAVINVKEANESRTKGFIPTGWYPSALTVSPDGKKLFVGVGKGLRFKDNARGGYIGDILNGAVSIVDIPDEKQLAEYTRQVLINTPVPKTEKQLSRDQIHVLKKTFGKIEHVLYIIRENRTYDQVFGDIAKGNGDPSITMFGEDVTPNAHALAKEYVLLDNLYCNGEVSEDGHEWCNAAYATDFIEKSWVDSYSQRGEPDGDERMRSSPNGFLWDNCARNKVTYRSYGEYAYFTSNKDAPPKFEGDRGLEGHASLKWSQVWNNVKDSRDTDHAKAFIEELHDYEKNGDWPQFMVMSLGEDHTRGRTPNWFTPIACVASNDQALGMIVDAVTHSKLWKKTAIFVIEDDAQSGFDHVDAHRTVGLIISPYTKRGAVDSTFYTTASFVRTMELILGLPPMSQYDTNATPCYNSFTTERDTTPFNKRVAKVDVLARNGTTGADEEASAKMDFSKYDLVEPGELNAILWRACKPGFPMPSPVRCMFLKR